MVKDNSKKNVLDVSIMRKPVSFRYYIYSKAENTRESKIKMCSKNHLGFLKHEASNMAAVSPCQVQAIELQLVV